MSEPTLEALAARAVQGDRDAAQELVATVQDDVYGLALRMLWHPHDAADATQEILVQVLTHLSDFRGDSQFRTWCFRIATNHLLRVKSKRAQVLADLVP